MEKLKFEVMIKAKPGDTKTNIYAITSITNGSNQTFIIPEQYQHMDVHKEIMKSEVFKKIKNSLKNRHDKRQVWITLTEEMKTRYIDESGNIAIENYLLEEIPYQQQSTSQSKTQVPQVDENLVKILEKLSQKKEENNESNLNKVSEKFVIDKFNGKNMNITQWITTFESECDRLKITEDIEKIEILRLFLVDSCKDWYSSMLIKNSLDSKWEIWKETFLESFADKGWSSIMYALNYKFLNNSLLDYALKKERILLETNKNIDKITLINLIAAGLPVFIRDKLDRQNLKNTEDLFNELKKYEHLIHNKNVGGKKNATNLEYKTIDKKPCRICENKGKKNRYHAENSCWYKGQQNTTNSILEVEINEYEQKN